MPNATGRSVHIDKLLTQMALGYRPEGFIADMIYPIVPVEKQTDLYTVWSRADRTRRQDTRRAPGTEARRIIESVGSDTYYAENYALKRPVTIEDKANADPALLAGLYNARAQFVMDHLLLDWEIRVADQVNSGSNVGSYTAVASDWSVKASGGSDPIGDINVAIDNVHYAQGQMPNRVVFGVEAWKSFRRHTDVRDLIFGVNNGGGYPNVEQVKNLLDIDNVMVGGAFQNTGEEGLSEALSTIWKDNVLVYYAPTTPNKERPSFGYAFRWRKPGIVNMTVERHAFDPKTKTEEVEIGYYQAEKITQAGYGFGIHAVNSST